uniref:Aminopeptidase n=1 Tax=Haemonchus contortus TaxID=6289 RepID=V5K5H8_HAECO|nr:aminopeptidase H11-5 [Haemonchus contortus]
MTVQWTKRTVLKFTPITLLLLLFLVAASIGLSIGLTYYFTRKAYDTTEKNKDHGADDNSPSAEELRLPKNIEPLLYDLSIKTYLPGYVSFPPEKNLTFDGQVGISLRVVEPTKSIVLNSKNITVIPDKCELFSGDKKLEIESIKEHERLEKLEILLKNRLEKDQEVLLKVGYTGIISNTLGGLYQATYTDTDGTVKRIAAATQHCPSDARRLVPCLDEPSFKASWTVTVIHPKGTKAVSNGIETNGKGEVSGDWIISKFETTPRMSSYLLAVVVSEFDYIEGFTKSGVRFRIWSRPEAKNMTAYARDAGIRCLEFYENFFDIKFPLKKQDMVALPDFSFGAMENWGLITYRESSLLYDDRYYTPIIQATQLVALVVAHELAHQWFGDLVTLKWWDDLWLNEGFARFVEYIGTDEINNKTIRMDDFFLPNVLVKALDADAVSSTHPLSFRVDKAAEVVEAFDRITYEKGASVLKMLQALIGQKNYKQAVTQYLRKFSYSNAQASDLWDVFDEVVKDVKGPDGNLMKTTEFASQWTTQVQMGFPLVTVKAFNATSLQITQTRYKTNKDALEPEKYRHPKYGFKWDVPLWYQEGDNKDIKFAWLTREKPLYLHMTKPDTTIVVNADRHGFYRQNYDANGWRKIIKQLKKNHKVCSARTRNAIIGDAFAAALIDELEYETVFKLLEYAKNEEEYLPWTEAISGFYAILDFFGNEPESISAKAFMKNILKPMYKKTSMKYIADNYENDSLFFEVNLQTSIIDAYCFLGARECIKNYADLFDKEVMKKCKDGDKASKCVSIAAPLRAKAYCYGVKEGGEAAFDKVMKLYYAENVQLEKDVLLQGLGCHKDITALKRLLLLALDRNSSFVRLQDVAAVYYAVSSNPIGKEFMFNFLLERWEEILEGLTTEHRAVERVIKACTAGIRLEQQIDQLRSLQKNGEHAREYGAFDGQIERAEHKINWIKKHMRKLSDFFEKSTR